MSDNRPAEDVAAAAAAEKAAAEKAAAEKAAAEKAAAERAKEAKERRPKRGDVIHFVARDELTGGQLDGFGVVVLSPEDGALTVRPLSDGTVQVDPAEVEPVVVDEV